MKNNISWFKRLFLIQFLFCSFCFGAEEKECVDDGLLAILIAFQANINDAFDNIEDSAGSGGASLVDELSTVIWESTKSNVDTIVKNTDALQDEIEYRTDSVIDELQKLQGIVDGLDQLVIDRNLSKSGNFITTGTTITSGGYYSLRATTTGCITVAASDVILDLGGFTLYCETGPVITIDAGLSNVEIKNGKLKSNGTQHGILVSSFCKLVMIENMEIFSCNYGINFNANSSCRIKNCDLHNSQAGVYTEFSTGMLFQNCNAFYCTFWGFAQEACSSSVYEKCNALHTRSSGGNAVAFYSLNGVGSLFSECAAIKTGGANAIGFSLVGENYTKIVNCVANKTEAVTSAYGIYLEGSTSCVLEGNETLNSSKQGIYLEQSVAQQNALLKNISYNNATRNYFPRRLKYPDPFFVDLPSCQLFDEDPYITNIFDYDYNSTCVSTRFPGFYDNLDIQR